MDERVAAFRLSGAAQCDEEAEFFDSDEDSVQQAVAPMRAVAGSGARRPVVQMRTAQSTAVKSEPDWKEF